MKETILKLDDNIRVYVLDELEYKNRKYIFTMQIDENDEPIEENVNVLEVVIEDNKLITKKIEDFEISSIVSNMFIARLRLEDNNN